MAGAPTALRLGARGGPSCRGPSIRVQDIVCLLGTQRKTCLGANALTSLLGGPPGGPPPSWAQRAAAGAPRWHRLIVLERPETPKETANFLSPSDLRQLEREDLLDVYRSLRGPPGGPPQHCSPDGLSAGDPLKGPPGGPLRGPPKVKYPLSPLHWQALAERTLAVSGCLCAKDILVVYEALRSSGLRDRQLQQELHARLRQLPAASFAAAEVRGLLRVLQHCGWRSVRTLRHLAAAFCVSVSDASPSCCRELMAAYARLRVPLEMETDRAAFAAAAKRLLQQVASLGPKEIYLSLNSSVRCTDTATLARLAAGLSPQIPRVSPSMSPMQLALTANALAAAAEAWRSQSTVLRCIEETAVAQRDTWGPQDAALLVNAFAKLEVYSQPLFDAAAEHATQHIAAYSPQHLTLTAHAFARFGVSPPSLLAAICLRVPRCLQQFKAQEVAVLAMALAKLGCTDSSVVHALTDEVFYRATVGRFRRHLSFCLLDLQQVSLALIKMGQRDPRLFAVLTDCSKQELRRAASGAPAASEGGPPGEGGPQAQTIACLAYALGKAGVKDERLSSLLERQFLQQERQFSSLGLSLVAAAAVSLCMRNSQMWMALQRQGALRAPHMPLDSLLSLLAAVSKAPPSAVSEAFLRAATTRLRLHILSLSPCSIAAALVSVQRLGWRDCLFLSRACSVLTRRQSELSTRALCGSFAALAKLAVRDFRVYVHLGKEIYARIHQLGQEDAASVLYALLLLQPQQQQLQQQRQRQQRQQKWLHQQQGQQIKQAEEADASSNQAVEEEQQEQQEQEQEQQQQQQQHQDLPVLHQFEGLLLGVLHALLPYQQQLTAATVYRVQLAGLYLHACVPGIFARLPGAAVSFLSQTASVSPSVAAGSSSVAQSSLLHRSVSRALSLACIPHQNEVRVGPLCLDVLLGPRVCVEIEGPSHYYRNTVMLTSSTSLKRCLLLALGFRVGTVSFLEWDQLTTRARKILFCLQMAQSLLQQTTPGRRSPNQQPLLLTASSATAAGPCNEAQEDRRIHALSNNNDQQQQQQQQQK